LKPLELLTKSQFIEKTMNRKRALRWGPRTIDLDILLYGNKRINHPHLIIPHPEIKNRPFVLMAIYELQQRNISPLTPTLSPNGGEGINLE
jgi:2-amino-4-hydroxy-6-hydroxymethyldihydropteridine diphosphokinase